MNTTDYKTGPASIFATAAREPVYEMECMFCNRRTPHKFVGEKQTERVEFYKCNCCQTVQTVRW